MFYIMISIAVLVLALIALIYINPGPKAVHSDKSIWLRKVPIAHRGYHDIPQAPENSILAAKRAIERGYAIELDVQRTADGRVVVFHDYSLKRMTGLDAKVSCLPWEAIKDLKLLKTEEKIPLFSEFLKEVQGNTPLLIEVKNEGAVGPLEQNVIDALRNYPGEFAIQSFNPFVMQYFYNNVPDYVRGQLSSNFKGEDLAFWKKFLLRNLLLNFLSRPSFIAYQYETLPKWLARRLKHKGLYLLTWTVTSPEDSVLARKLFDNVIFEGYQE